MTVAMLDDLEEVAAVPDRAVLACRDAELAPRRQVHQLRSAATRARVHHVVGTGC